MVDCTPVRRTGDSTERCSAWVPPTPSPSPRGEGGPCALARRHAGSRSICGSARNISVSARGRSRRTGGRWRRRSRRRRLPRAGWCGRRVGGRIAPGTRGQVLVDGLVAELGQQIEAAALGDELRDRASGIAEVAEVARAGRAGTHAGGDAILLGQVLVIDAVDAQRAFLHDAVVVVVLARTVGARPRAQLAADAGVRDRPARCRPRRA